MRNFDVLYESVLFNLTEKSKLKDDSILNKLKPYANDSSYYVTFTALKKVGINPKNNFSTPIGVYAYNLKDLWDHWSRGNDFFGKDRPYCFLIREASVRKLELNSYRFSNKDLLFLEEIYGRVASGSFEDFLSNCRRKTSSNSNLYKSNRDGAVLWQLTQDLSRLLAPGDSKSFTVRWNKLFRDMGYDFIYDNGSIIHLLQNSQAVFFSPRSYEVMGMYMNRFRGEAPRNEEKYWGTSQQPYWRPGPNPTVDLVVVAEDEGKNKVLLIKRSSTAKAEANKWAIPGGFVDTNTKVGERFEYDRETPKQAAIREVTEETRLYLANIPNLAQRLVSLGEFEGNNRDPRDNKEAWAKSHAFAIRLTREDGIDIHAAKGQDDASEASWFDVDELPSNLAFDHASIIEKALQVLSVK